MKRILATIAILVFSSSLAWGQRNDCRVIDGRIYLIGEYQRLFALSAQSPEGRLSLDTEESPNGVTVELTLPFSGAFVAANDPQLVSFGVLGESGRIDVGGTTPTSILYDGDMSDARRELAVFYGAGDSVVPQVCGYILPEPAGCGLLSGGLIAMLLTRPSRRK